MRFESVLGYTDNSFIADFEGKYFEELLGITKSILGNNIFFENHHKRQKLFLTHPDISSLLIDYSDTKSKESLAKFLHEIRLFLNEKYNEMTCFKGEKIQGTNIYITTEDNNPKNKIVGHPDHDEGGMIGWGDRSPEEWNKIFSNTFKLLKSIDIGYYDELNSFIKKIVPMKTSYGIHNSCSYKECIGTLYLGYTIDSPIPELNILEALVHESNHNKLNLVMQTASLHKNSYDLKYYSPYRPDARHIQGVLLGIHAIIPAVYVMLLGVQKGIIRDKGWSEKILLYHVKNKIGFKVIKKHMNRTFLGENIIEEIQHVLGNCDIILQSLPEMRKIDLAKIQTYAKAHFMDVKNNYPYMQY